MLQIEENISVKNIKTVYNKLKDEFEKSDEVMLDFANVKRVDLSVIQLIIAAGRFARENNKTLRLRSVSEYLKEQMHICGVKT